MPREFKVDEMFEASYGIYPPEDEPPVLVTVRTTPREAAYLKDLPIHPSQVYLGEDSDGRSLFVFRVIPNPDLVMELCKRGSRLEVGSPEALRQQAPQVSPRGSFSASSSFWAWLAVLGAPWFVDTSLQSLPPSSVVFSLWGLYPNPPFL